MTTGYNVIIDSCVRFVSFFSLFISLLLLRIPPRYFFLFACVLRIFFYVSFSLALYCRFFDGKQRADVGSKWLWVRPLHSVSRSDVIKRERKRKKEKGGEGSRFVFLRRERESEWKRERDSLSRKKRRPARLNGRTKRERRRKWGTARNERTRGHGWMDPGVGWMDNVGWALQETIENRMFL